MKETNAVAHGNHAQELLGWKDWKSGRFTLRRNTFGSIGEEIVLNCLRKDGFKISGFEELLYRRKGCSKVGALAELCMKKKEGLSRREQRLISLGLSYGHCIYSYGEGERPCMKAKDARDSQWQFTHTVWESCQYYLSEYCEQVCRRFCRNRKIWGIFEEVGKMGWRDRRKGGLDYVVSKNGKLWVAEVKTGKHGELHDSQRRLTERLRREMGIGLLQFHVCLQDELNYSIRFKCLDQLMKL